MSQTGKRFRLCGGSCWCCDRGGRGVDAFGSSGTVTAPTLMRGGPSSPPGTSSTQGFMCRRGCPAIRCPNSSMPGCSSLGWVELVGRSAGGDPVGCCGRAAVPGLVATRRGAGGGRRDSVRVHPNGFRRQPGSDGLPVGIRVLPCRHRVRVPATRVVDGCFPGAGGGVAAKLRTGGDTPSAAVRPPSVEGAGCPRITGRSLSRWRSTCPRQSPTVGHLLIAAVGADPWKHALFNGSVGLFGVIGFVAVAATVVLALTNRRSVAVNVRFDRWAWALIVLYGALFIQPADGGGLPTPRGAGAVLAAVPLQHPRRCCG